MQRDTEDIKFELLIGKKRHDELLSALEKIAGILSSSNNNEIIVQTKKLSQVVELLQNLIRVADREPIDVTPIERACREVVESNERLIATLDGRLLPESFDIIRDMNGIKTVRVNYAPANEMITV